MQIRTQSENLKISKLIYPTAELPQYFQTLYRFFIFNLRWVGSSGSSGTNQAYENDQGN